MKFRFSIWVFRGFNLCKTKNRQNRSRCHANRHLFWEISVRKEGPTFQDVTSMVEEERRSKAYAKILNQASTYQQVSQHLLAGQAAATSRSGSTFYQVKPHLPAGQAAPSSRSSRTYQQVRQHLLAGQATPTSRSASTF